MITVLDVNDSPPTFVHPVYNATISEEAPSSSHITTLVAHDADIGSNADVSYSIISGNDGHFTVNPNTGQIRTSGRLDRETMAAYSLGIRASDGRQSTVTTLEVNIQDANDNDPTFTKPTYSFTVPESHAVGTAVDAVSASDPDAGTNGDVIYSIVSEGAPGEDVFRLDSLTGEFTLLTELDYEQVLYNCFKSKCLHACHFINKWKHLWIHWKCNMIFVHLPISTKYCKTKCSMHFLYSFLQIWLFSYNANL